MSKLTFLSAVASIVFTSPATLPVYKGSTFRGALGHALRRAACALPERRDCRGCPVAGTCPYKFLFEPSDLPISRRFRDAPRPFVLVPPGTDVQYFAAGDALELKLTLVGDAIEYLPYFALAVDDMGRRGIGKGRRGRFRLTGIYAADKLVYDPAAGTLHDLTRYIARTELDAGPGDGNTYDVTVDLVTPTRLTAGGRVCEDITLNALARAVFRRVSALGVLYCGWTEIPSYDGLLKAADRAHVLRDETNWFEWERYSSRQDRRMGMGGLIGPVTFGDVPGALVPWLRAGSVTHVGKGATFGLGGYRLAAKTSGKRPEKKA